MESTINVNNIVDIYGMEALKTKMARIERMIEAVDAKTSSKAICFGDVQPCSKRKLRSLWPI